MEPAPLSEKDHAKMLEDEHLLLQRQFRSVETDRRHASLGVHPGHRRQVVLIRSLREEYVDLEKDLKIARSGAHKKRDERMTKDLKSALLQNQEARTHAEEGYRLLEEINGLIHLNAKEVLHLKRIENSSKDKQITQRRLRSEQRLVAMENRLEVATRRFNAVYHENTKLRDQIEHMLKDRAIFNEAWVKMILALSKGKRYMSEIFDQSTMAYDQRDEWCSKLRSIQEKGKMDLVLQTQEMRELQKNLDHDWATHSYLSAKGVTRVNENLAVTQKRKEEEAIRENEEQLERHNNILNDVKEYAETDDINAIVENFKIGELHNLAVYRLLNDTCADIQMLVRQVQKIRAEIKERRRWYESLREGLDYSKQKLRHQLERQLETNMELSSKVEHHDQTLSKIERDVEDMFRILGCSMDTFEELLGDKKPTLRHSALSLCVISEKIKQDISLVYYDERCASKGLKTIQKGGRSRLKKFVITHEAIPPLAPTDVTSLVRSEPCSVCVEARWLAKVPEHQEQPMSKEEAVQAAKEMREDLAYEKEELMHSLTECRLPRNRPKNDVQYE